ncbi:MAG: hypothetical protein C0623_12130 [Desulfuromonas sp.]|nr:MAG: hypothetical protein C0623_12130 [Desulfuromonas sp.]
MNITNLIRFSLIVLLLSLLATPVFAGGIGMYFQDGKVTDGDWDGDYDFDIDSTHHDFGFVVDSNLATNRMFNYRLELGRTMLEIEDYNNRAGVDADLDGLVMNHNFGFGGLVAPNIRLWFGPEIRMELIEGDLEGATARDFDLYGFGVGATAGVNFNFPGRLSMSAKGGYIMMGYHGRGPNWNGTAWESSHFSADTELAYVNFAFFFRTQPR